MSIQVFCPFFKWVIWLFFFLIISTFNYYLFIYPFLFLFFFGCVGSSFLCKGFLYLRQAGGHSSLWCAGLSLSRPLLLRSTGSRRAGSAVVAHGSSCSAACGIFPDQGSNPCPLHWQADSQPLRHQGSPAIRLFAIGCESLMYFGCQPLIRHVVCKYFLPFCRLLFHFVNRFFCCAEAFWFAVDNMLSRGCTLS